MKIAVDVPDDKVTAVMDVHFEHDYRCHEDCEYFQQQMYALLMGWA